MREFFHTSVLSPRFSTLSVIAGDSNFDIFVRECAAQILAMHSGRDAKPVLKQLIDLGSWYSQELQSCLDEYGSVNPYT